MPSTNVVNSQNKCRLRVSIGRLPSSSRCMGALLMDLSKALEAYESAFRELPAIFSLGIRTQSQSSYRGGSDRYASCQSPPTRRRSIQEGFRNRFTTNDLAGYKAIRILWLSHQLEHKSLNLNITRLSCVKNFHPGPPERI